MLVSPLRCTRGSGHSFVVCAFEGYHSCLRHFSAASGFVCILSPDKLLSKSVVKGCHLVLSYVFNLRRHGPRHFEGDFHAHEVF